LSARPKGADIAQLRVSAETHRNNDSVRLDFKAEPRRAGAAERRASVVRAMGTVVALMPALLRMQHIDPVIGRAAATVWGDFTYRCAAELDKREGQM
jgi:hypothetical protein